MDEELVVECDSCQAVMNDLAQMEIMHAQVTSQLESDMKELEEMKARRNFLGACKNCSKLSTELEAHALKVKELESKCHDEPRFKVLPPPCIVCASLKDKLVITRKENHNLTQENEYLTYRLKRTLASEERIESDLPRIKDCVNHSNYNLGLGFERCDKESGNVGKFVPSSDPKK